MQGRKSRARFTISLIFSLFILTTVIGQTTKLTDAFQIIEKRGEVVFSFSLNKQEPIREQLNRLTHMISIDKVENKVVTAYANRKEFKDFLELGIDYTILPAPSMQHTPLMVGTDALRSRADWDFYPTYPAYETIMNQFAADYPDLCEVVNIKTLPSGHKLLFIHINDSLGVDQNEPEFMYTSSIHGDETSGYVTSLHLIDYLLTNYGSDQQATNLVENLDIWINPLSNPDGTYAGGDNTVYGATRYNANGVDMNRNYPDPEDGQHPDGNDWQDETVAFMDFAGEHDFVMSANFHDGTEVCNYPWDTWYKRHPDDDWWIYVCRQWADTVHFYGPQGYFDDLNNGITNGYDWYSISGGRQDYMNYFHHCREFTLEISKTKLIPASQLLSIWDYQHRSMLNYMEQCLYGVHGKVTNAVNGNPVPAEVWIEDHDKDESQVTAGLPVGDYHRPVKEGTYDITFSSFGYYPKTIENVNPVDMSTLVLNVALQPYVNLSANFSASDTIIEKGSYASFSDLSEGAGIVSWEWNFDGATPSTSNKQNPDSILYTNNGTYDVSLTVTDSSDNTSTLLKEDYMLVTEAYTMSDTTVHLCDGLFYDSGGPEGNYQDNETFTMTFISMLESGSLEVVFTGFDVEEDVSCSKDFLEAYDGTSTDAPFIGAWCGNDLPGSITAHNIDGAITFRFVSNDTINMEGWKAFVSCDTSVGIKELPGDELVLFPNPASGSFSVSYGRKVKQIEVYSLTGQLLIRTDNINSMQQVNTESLENGMYIVVIATAGKVYSKKLIIHNSFVKRGS